MSSLLKCPQLPWAAFSAAILASIFFLAARIISSLRRCSDTCLSSLFELHPLPFFSSCSAASGLSLPPRLYRVIKSGCVGLSGCLAAVEVLAPAAAWPGGGGGWKVIGGYQHRVSMRSLGEESRRAHTVSKRPAKILSVVFCMFPPFRCRSHKTLRLSACGNICCILPTASSRDLKKASGDLADGWLGGPEKKRYRTIRPETTRMAAKYGREIWSFDMMSIAEAQCKRSLGRRRRFRGGRRSSRLAV